MSQESSGDSQVVPIAPVVESLSPQKKAGLRPKPERRVNPDPLEPREPDIRSQTGTHES